VGERIAHVRYFTKESFDHASDPRHFDRQILRGDALSRRAHSPTIVELGMSNAFDHFGSRILAGWL
jgi:hypothetical protein